MSKTKNKIILDADGLPVRGICTMRAQAFDIPLVIVKNIHHFIESDYGVVITVGDLPDEVDHEIVKQCRAGDLVVTQDFGLASLVLGAKAFAMHPNGFFYTDENIDQLLLERHLNAKQRRAGTRLKPMKKRTREQDIAFDQALVSFLQTGF